jgi:hypothetical protein
VTVNSFNTALPPGSVLASFTADTKDNNSVAFTMSTLTPGKRYFVNVGGSLVNTTYADNDGVIRFNRSIWPAGVFTVVEDASTTPPGSSISDLNNDINKDGIVDTLDIELVSNHIQPGIIKKVYNYFKSWI